MSETSTPTIRFRHNGERVACAVAPDTRLSALLRDGQALSGAKEACGIGRCGACTVLMDGLPVNACLTMAWQIDGRDIVSPEGLDTIDEAAIVRQALTEESAFQCGYCAPGFTVVLTALLRDNARPSETQIRAALEGNLCRCTGYHSIIRGALRAVDLLAAHHQPTTPGDPS